MSSSYFTPNQADLVSSAPAFYSQEVSTEYHVQSYDMSLSINNETSCYRISMPVEDGEGHRAQVTSDIDQYAIAHVAFDFENSFELIALSTPPNEDVYSLIESLVNDMQSALTMRVVMEHPGLLSCVQGIYRVASSALIKDPRKHQQTIYPLPVILTVAVLARLCGFFTNREIALFYRSYRGVIGYLIGIPPDEFSASRETIRRALKCCSPDTLERIFFKFFGRKIRSSESNEGLFNTDLKIYAFDGQENRSGYVKGNPNRMVKGNHIVSLVEGGSNMVVAFKNVDKKNNEVQAFLDMLAMIDDASKCLFTCDALNSRKGVLEAVLAKNGHCGLKLKGNSILLKEIKGVFESNTPCIDEMEFIATETGGKIAFHTISKFALTENNVPSLSDWKGITTAVRVSTIRQRIIDGRSVSRSEKTYYMAFTTDNMEVIKKTITETWCCETMHYTNDLVFMSDRMAITDKAHIGAKNAMNKVAYNVISFCRSKADKFDERPFVHHLKKNAVCPLYAVASLSDFLTKCQGYELKPLAQCSSFKLEQIFNRSDLCFVESA